MKRTWYPVSSPILLLAKVEIDSLFDPTYVYCTFHVLMLSSSRV
jgi:hypothetical protein